MDSRAGTCYFEISRRPWKLVRLDIRTQVGRGSGTGLLVAVRGGYLGNEVRRYCGLVKIGFRLNSVLQLVVCAS